MSVQISLAHTHRRERALLLTGELHNPTVPNSNLTQNSNRRIKKIQVGAERAVCNGGRATSLFTLSAYFLNRIHTAGCGTADFLNTDTLPRDPSTTERRRDLIARIQDPRRICCGFRFFAGTAAARSPRFLGYART